MYNKIIQNIYVFYTFVILCSISQGETNSGRNITWQLTHKRKRMIQLKSFDF